MKDVQIFLLALFFLGCKTSKKDIEIVCDHRNEVFSNFKDISIYRRGLNNYIFFETHKNDTVNRYVFFNKHGEVNFLRENILYSPDLTLGIDKGLFSRRDYANKLEDKLDSLLDKMDKLKISDITSGFFNSGIEFKIYMKRGGVLLYVPSGIESTEGEWKNYLSSMKSFNDKWFYSVSGN